MLGTVSQGSVVTMERPDLVIASILLRLGVDEVSIDLSTWSFYLHSHT